MQYYLAWAISEHSSWTWVPSTGQNLQPWWCLHMSEKFSSGMKNPKQTNKIIDIKRWSNANYKLKFKQHRVWLIVLIILCWIFFFRIHFSMKQFVSLVSRTAEVIKVYQCPQASKTNPPTSTFSCQNEFTLESNGQSFNFSSGDT